MNLPVWAAPLLILIGGVILESFGTINIGAQPLLATTVAAASNILTCYGLFMHNPAIFGLIFLFRLVAKSRPLSTGALLSLFEPLSCLFALGGAAFLERNSPLLRQHRALAPFLDQIVPIISPPGVSETESAMNIRIALIALSGVFLLPFCLLIRSAIAITWYGVIAAPNPSPSSSSSNSLNFLSPVTILGQFVRSHSLSALLGFPFLNLAVIEWNVPLREFVFKHIFEILLVGVVSLVRVVLLLSASLAPSAENNANNISNTNDNNNGESATAAAEDKKPKAE